MWVLWTIIRGLTRSLQSEENTIHFSYALWLQPRKTFTSSDELSEHIFNTLKDGFNDLLAQDNGQNEEKKLSDYYEDTIYNIFKEETHYPFDAASWNRIKILEVRNYFRSNQEDIMSLLISLTDTYYTSSEYPSDWPWMSIINGIRTNFVDGTKWKQADWKYTVEKTRNEQIKQIWDKLIAEKKFQIHSVTYDGYQIPVFSLWDEANNQRVSITTTQHMIPVDRAEQWNKENSTKKQIKKFDFKDRTPLQNTPYDASTMGYYNSNLWERSEKRTRKDDTDGLPYGDHLMKMADGGCDEWVSITIEHESAWYFESTFMPLLGRLSWYENVTTLNTTTDIHTLLWYLIGTCGLLYYNDGLSCCFLSDDFRWIDSNDLVVSTNSALFAKVTPSSRRSS